MLQTGSSTHLKKYTHLGGPEFRILNVFLTESNNESAAIYAACNVEKFSNDSQFDSNLAALLKTLTEKAAYASFSASVYGQETLNKVSERLQCRGDLSHADCQVCSAQALKVIHRECPNAIGARVQLEHCFLRYENYTFLSDFDTKRWYDVVNVPRQPYQVRPGLISVTIYCMEMCWRDMSKDDGASCLSKGYEEVFSISSQKVGAQVFLGSCTLRYEIYPFTEHH
ncbi:hypothetical protein SUGI_0781820 [Cryptomeria japonica]|nr:hypothetical protein SUGI_0781820 [Cryptomeria japonica]